MSAAIHPDATDVVVMTADAKAASALSRRLSELGHVEPVQGHPGFLVVSPTRQEADPAGQLRKAIAGLDADVRVEPLLRDEHGNALVPTGKVTVRFKSEPSAEDLRRFAGPLGLSVDARNKYVPSQVSFRIPGGDPVSLVVERIQQQDDRVLQAWPETLGLYRRA